MAYGQADRRWHLMMPVCSSNVRPSNVPLQLTADFKVLRRLAPLACGL